MRTFSHLQRESNRIGADFLITKLETALILLSTAETSGSAEARRRIMDLARVAYESVLPLQRRVTMTPRQKELYQQRIDALQLKLKAGADALRTSWGNPWDLRLDH